MDYCNWFTLLVILQQHQVITFAVPTNPNNLVVYYGCSVHPNQGGSLTLTDFNAQQ